jgi:PPK2 family polyphosphate:nucleotide phosphotransferase
MANRKSAEANDEPRAGIPSTLGDLLRLPPGPVDLDSIPTAATPGFAGAGKADAKTATGRIGTALATQQRQLRAEGRTGGRRSVLLMLQGMDTSGKSGTAKNVLRLMDPTGTQHHSFGPPTLEEREEHFLWRIRRALPPPGTVAVFDRSHYEDVLVPRVHELVPAEVWSRRYESINLFEAELAQSTRIVKCFLHISPREQTKRLQARLNKPRKQWKYDPKDLDERSRWTDYQQAYADILDRCNTEAAPWYLIPADRKWYRDWAIARLLAEQLNAMALTWPRIEWDIQHERARLDNQTPASSVPTLPA